MSEFDKYFQEVETEFKRGEYTELTFRTILQNFLGKLNNSLTLSEENKKIKSIGRPDYTCFKKKIIKIGYVETKDLNMISTDEKLKKILNTEQIIRYSNEAIPNMVITDYSRFILYRNREILFDVKLFGEDDLKKGSVGFNSETMKNFEQLIEVFLSYDLPTIKNARELALELSKRAKLLRDWSSKQLKEDFDTIKRDDTPSPIYYFYEAFKELIKDAQPIDCVDAYAQTITYGLFLSKIGSHDGVKRDSAVTYIPSSIKIIKTIFKNIAGDELPKELSWIVDEIVDILNATDINKILSEFVFEGKNYKDPFIHFYENFLIEYDPAKRKHLGVYYTPEPVVSFITRSINEILKKEFGKNTGFADDSVKVLDFATGTGTFLANAFVLALQEIRKAGLTGIERQKIKNHLLKNFYGFEILISPYVIAHLKLGLLLMQEGYELKDDERVQVYLTNTLDPMEKIQGLHAFLRELTFETIKANKIKLETPILVITGNPPYSSSSSNRSEWILGKIDDYKKGLDEKKYNLDDDYIKFIRFAQWKIEQNKSGILGIISNNSYLDQPTFKLMRRKLIESFDKFHILNLRGDQRRDIEVKEGKDFNVFDIQQGVAIILFVKYPKRIKKEFYYHDLIGKRENKFGFLNENNVVSTDWKNFQPKEPENFLMYKEFSGKRKYDKFFAIKKIFNEFSISVLTKKDKFIVAYDKKELLDNLNVFASGKLSEVELKKRFDLQDIEVRDAKGGKKYEWEITSAQKKLSAKGIDSNLIIEYNYRPFDFAYTYYSPDFLSRDRKAIMTHILNKKNVGLLIGRAGQNVKSKQWDLAFITDIVPDQNMFYRGGATFMPLYTYKGESSDKQLTLSGDSLGQAGKQPNFSKEFMSFIKEQYPNKEILPEEVLSYIYAVLHSPNYRTKFEEFLKIDYPKIPFVEDYKKFKKLSDLGNELVKYHLMKKLPKKNVVGFEVSGTDELTAIKHEGNKLYINDKQYFSGISEEVWMFHIGGYQVLDKWLKSRKGQKLTYKEIETFIKIAGIISETIKLMGKIDNIKIA